jgi:hypothetical protein
MGPLTPVNRDVSATPMSRIGRWLTVVWRRPAWRDVLLAVV